MGQHEIAPEVEVPKFEEVEDPEVRKLVVEAWMQGLRYGTEMVLKAVQEVMEK